MWNPAGDGVTNLTAQWHPEPHQRGTFNILSTCLTTIFLCAWTALHPNIPEHKKTDVQLWRKIKWVLIGILAPEIVRTLWNMVKPVMRLLSVDRLLS